MEWMLRLFCANLSCTYTSASSVTLTLLDGTRPRIYAAFVTEPKVMYVS